MKSRIVAVVLLVAAALTMGNDQKLRGQAQADGRPVGRFQLIPGAYNVIFPNGNTYTEQTVFKIDTVTGETWRYSNNLMPPKGEKRWSGFVPAENGN